MDDIQLTENVDNKNAFEVRSSSTGQYYTFLVTQNEPLVTASVVALLQAFSSQVKKKWVDAIKKLLIESLPDIPDKVSAPFQLHDLH